MTSRTPRILALAAGTAAAGLLVTGCSQSTEEASEAYCASVDQLDAELVALQTLITENATKEEVSDQAEEVRDAYDDTRDASGDLGESVQDEAGDAYDAFQDTVSDIPDDATVTQALDVYAAAAQAYVQDLVGVAEEAGCN